MTHIPRFKSQHDDKIALRYFITLGLNSHSPQKIESRRKRLINRAQFLGR